MQYRAMQRLAMAAPCWSRIATARLTVSSLRSWVHTSVVQWVP